MIGLVKKTLFLFAFDLCSDLGLLFGTLLIKESLEFIRRKRRRVSYRERCNRCRTRTLSKSSSPRFPFAVELFGAVLRGDGAKEF